MPDGTTPIVKPEHSPLGGSSAERWIECPGSYALVEQIGSGAAEAPDYQKDGTTAHALAAHCLDHGIGETWEASGEFPAIGGEGQRSVQTYLNYCRSRPGTRAYTEYGISHPKFHPMMYSRLDRCVHDPEPGIALEIIDYKHGVGVVVEADSNAQERYYGFCYISGDDWPTDLPRLEDMARVKLTVVQPRAFHGSGEPIRSVVVTAGELRNWAHNTLLPAMNKAGTREFKMGEWCRFCPAKLVCPEMRKLGTDAALAQVEAEKDGALLTFDDEWIDAWYGRLSSLRMFISAIGAEADRRIKAGSEFKNAKLVYAKVDRVFKPSATEPVVDPDLGIEEPAPIFRIFGDEAWAPRVLRSPAQLEKLPGGKDFCAEWAQKPVAGLVIAPASDTRTAQKPQTSEDVFKDVVKTP